MADLLNIMLNVISPIFLMIGVAFIIGKIFNPDVSGFSTLLIYLFIPALVFKGIATTTIPTTEIAGIAFVVIGMTLIMMVIGLLIARWQGYPTRLASAFVLSTMLVNAANYGIPLNTFAFGETGGQVALVFYVSSALMGNLLGVFFASRGQVNSREALLNVFKVPIGYAAFLGLIINLAGIELPLPINRAIDVASSAAVPGMLALLGLSLARTTLKGRIKPILLATGTRLMIAPFVGLFLASLIGLTGIPFKVAIIESSMPTAVLASALATQFGSDDEFTAAVTLTSTLFSVVTLTIIIQLLGGVIT